VNKSVPGFSLLLVLSLLAGLGSGTFFAWRQASLAFDIVMEREQWYKGFYALEILFNKSLNVISHHFDSLLNNSKKQPISLLFETEKQHFNGIITIKNYSALSHPCLLFYATLLPNKQSRRRRMSISCLLIKDTYANQKKSNQKPNKQAKLLVQYFSLNNTF